MNSFCVDIFFFVSYKWNVIRFSVLFDIKDVIEFIIINKFWIDVQFRYGDYDFYDIECYICVKYLDYIIDSASIYFFVIGFMIGIDFVYNLYLVYGMYFFGLKVFVQQVMVKIMKVNFVLYVLCECIRKGF